MPAIVVHAGGFGDDELRNAGAIAIYDNPGDGATTLMISRLYQPQPAYGSGLRTELP